MLQAAALPTLNKGNWEPQKFIYKICTLDTIHLGLSPWERLQRPLGLRPRSKRTRESKAVTYPPTPRGKTHPCLVGLGPAEGVLRMHTPVPIWVDSKSRLDVEQGHSLVLVAALPAMYHLGGREEHAAPATLSPSVSGVPGWSSEGRMVSS